MFSKLSLDVSCCTTEARESDLDNRFMAAEGEKDPEEWGFDHICVNGLNGKQSKE